MITIMIVIVIDCIVLYCILCLILYDMLSKSGVSLREVIPTMVLNLLEWGDPRFQQLLVVASTGSSWTQMSETGGQNRSKHPPLLVETAKQVLVG